MYLSAAYNNGVQKYMGTDNYYNCEGCGVPVLTTKWHEHLNIHAAVGMVGVTPTTTYSAPPVQSFNADDILARLRRMEDFYLRERQQLMDELEALRSIMSKANVEV